jgi:hypothetical protein
MRAQTKQGSLLLPNTITRTRREWLEDVLAVVLERRVRAYPPFREIFFGSAEVHFGAVGSIIAEIHGRLYLKISGWLQLIEKK